YDSLRGRFFSRDPIGYVGSQWGLSGFANGNPTAGFDPLGNEWTLPLPYGGGPPQYGNPHLYVHGDGNKRCIFVLAPYDVSSYPHLSTIPNVGVFGGITNPHDIPNLMEERGCCEILIFGHQGGPHYRGGATIEPEPLPGEEQRYIPVFRNPFVREKISKVREKNCPDGCGIFLYSCGDPHPDRDPMRRRIAKGTGCHVFGSTDYFRSAKMKGTKWNTACKDLWGEKPSPKSTYCPMPLIHYPPPRG
ncbi:MAG: hypothetical protein KDB00_08170, partial [Planctomycetales bacterium]|nr:hypothetical protein [Planctomycetales bacterium]